MEARDVLDSVMELPPPQCLSNFTGDHFLKDHKMSFFNWINCFMELLAAVVA